MLKKLLQTKIGVTAICIVIFLAALSLYWRTFNGSAIVEIAAGPTSADMHTPEVSAPLPNSGPDTQTPFNAPTEETPLPSSVAAPDAKEVAEAIDFLESIGEENNSKTGSSAEVQEAERTTELSQDEMFQLVREGVSYYDSLLESGSVDFFLQSSSVDYPGKIRPPSGTLQGSFEFSGSRVRAIVTEDLTQYDLEMTRTIQRTRQYAYDGETFETLRDTQRGPLMGRESEVQYTPSHDPRFWGWDLSANQEPLVHFIETLNIQNIEYVEWNGSQTYHVTGTYQETIDVDLWLNPEKSYRPERFMFTIPGEEMTRVTKDFNFQEVVPDLWFPESAEKVTTVVNAATGAETDIYIQSVHFTNVQINEQIPSHRFALDPPPGTTVFDGRTRETFTVPENGN